GDSGSGRRCVMRAEQERRLSQELHFHIDQYAADLVRQGYAPEDARRQAQVEFGGGEQGKEQCRDTRPLHWRDDFAQDLGYALRGLRQRPGFSAAALATLALGIGATTLMFTVIDGVMLKPLPWAHPEQLLALQEQTEFSTRFGNRWPFSYLNYLDCVQAVK